MTLPPDLLKVSAVQLRLAGLSGFIDAVFEFRNHLGAQQEDNHCDLDAQQGNHGGCQGAIDHVDQGDGRIIPDQNMADNFPQYGGGVFWPCGRI